MDQTTSNDTRVEKVRRINADVLVPILILFMIVFIWVVLFPTNVATGQSLNRIYIDQSKSEQSTINPTYQQQTTRLIGIVSDAVNDLPVSSASVIITDSVSHVYTTTTAANGWYTFTETITNPLEAGSVTIYTSKAGYRPKSLSTSITSGIDNQQDIQLDTSDLVVTKSDGRSTVIPGQTISYTIAITNVGTISATNILITDVLPSSLSYISDTLGITPTIPVVGTYVWDFPSSLSQDDTVSFQLKTKVANALSSPTEEIINTVEVRSSSPEATLTDNTAEDLNTATGTPNIGITLSVSPSQVRTGQNAYYTIKVTNTGTVLVTDVVVEDTFSTYLDLISATTTKGTATRNNTTRKVTAEFTPLNPNETVTISVVTRVNSASTINRTIANQATVEYLFGGSTTSRTSNTASFLLIASSTLPSTGGFEIDPREQGESPAIFFVVLISGLLLVILGLAVLAYGIITRKSRYDWSLWYMRMGIIITTVGALFLVFHFGLVSYSRSNLELSAQKFDVSTLAKQVYLPLPEEGPVWPSNTENEEQALPDYPVPTQTELNLPDSNNEKPDTSPINRIVIPALAVDTEVKYVPFDGFTWAIGGLRDEVAWMGETSWPGLVGNTALAGHVSLWDGRDGPFRHLDKLISGDHILIQTDENLYSYQVRERQIVSETDLYILDPHYDQQLTLITCTGWNPDIKRYLERLVVIAELVEYKPLGQVISSR